ncbi:MAG: BlaI/MecI/CopY family transcriptional regulator [Planctomycetota bacterium]|nr:BlaI/MecI/CopY family transcriptional regulator [Planctomycetota bacterium]
MPTPKRPTEAEMNILGVIWERGSATVREVFEQLQTTQDTGHTTVLKLMQIMVEKGLLERDADVRPQVFRATQPRKKTQSLLVRHLLDRAFSGSASALVVQALSLRKSTPEQLQEIRELIDRLEDES